MDLFAQLFERFGLFIVFVNTLVHELGVPLPLTPTVLLAGAATTQHAAMAMLVGAIVAGTLMGNAVWFAAGRRYGSRMLGLLCRLSPSQDRCMGRAGSAFHRWGGALFVVGRFIPGVSLFAPPIAGALGMSWTRFLTLSTLGAALWASVIVLLGAALEKTIAPVVDAVSAIPAGVWLSVVAAAGSYLVWRGFRQRSKASRCEREQARTPSLRCAAL